MTAQKLRRKPSHIPLFPDAYHKDTTHLTTEEHGAYFLLLMAAWGTNDCSLPNDERRLAAYAKLSLARWRKVAPTILEFWTDGQGRLTQKRLRREWEYVLDKRAKAKAAVDVREQKRHNGRSSDDASGDTSNDTSGDYHLGGGVGEGEDSYPRAIGFKGRVL